MLYAIALDWPVDGNWVIKSLKSGKSDLLQGPIKSVELLGSKQPISWKQTGEGLVVTAPAEKPCDYAFVLKVKTEE